MLRSMVDLKDNSIHATDGNIGHVKDFYFDDQGWAIRYLIVETGSWWLGHQVLIAPLWIEEIRWEDRSVSVNLTRQAVKDAAPYDDTVELNREEEINLHRHYERVGYWEQEKTNKAVTLPK
jgi:hypothetical protein